MQTESVQGNQESGFKIQKDARDVVCDVSVMLSVRPRMGHLVDNCKQLKEYFSLQGRTFELVVIGAFEPNQAQKEKINAAAELFASDKGQCFKFMRVRERLGLADHLRSLKSRFNGKQLLVIESSESLDQIDLAALFNKLNEGHDFVNGVRDWKGEPFINQFQSTMFNWLTAKLTGTPVKDVNSTIKVFNLQVLNALPLYGDFYRFLPALAQKEGFDVASVLLSKKTRSSGITFYGPFSYVRRFLDILNLVFITRFTEKPLRFFGGFGTGALAAGVLLNLLLVFQKFAYAKAMSERPLLLLAILLVVVGVQFISIGLIGEIIVYSKTKDNEGYEVEEII